MAVGECRASIKRFYYDITEKACKIFQFSGCKGNRNNFESLQECSNQCEQRSFENEMDEYEYDNGDDEYENELEYENDGNCLFLISLKISLIK